MLTTSNISSVSYNTQTNLKRVLDDLIEKNKIDFYAYIVHYPEKDEKKSHIHLFVIPNSKVDTSAFRDLFDEVDPQNPTKPLRCLPFEKTKNFADWYLYGIHDTTYLASKQQARIYHYTKEDFVVSDDMYFNELIHKIDYSKFNKNQVIIDAIQNGMSFPEMVRKGVVPVQLINQYQKMFEILKNNQTFRGIDPETGEVRESHSPKEKEEDLPF